MTSHTTTPAAGDRARVARVGALARSALLGGVLLAAVALALAGCRPSLERRVEAQEAPASPVLRERLDAYLAEGPGQPTTPANRGERTDLLWDWGNVRSLAGHRLPVDLTAAVHRSRLVDLDGSAAPPALLRQIDGYLRELATLEREPGAFGATRFADDAPLTAESWTTIEQIFTCGSRPPRAGAVLVVGAHFMADQSPLQHEDPAAEGYLSVRSSRAGAEFEPMRVPWRGMHGSYLQTVPQPAFRLGGADLEPGDTVTFVYGDPRGGSRGFRVQTVATERLELPLYLDLEGSGWFVAPEWSSLRVVGRPEAASLDVVAPSVVGMGEPFALSVRVADRWLNRASGAIPALEVRLAGAEAVVARLPAGGEALLRVDGLRLARTGIHRFEVRSTDGRLAAHSNPVRVLAEPSHRVLWGELHAHTDFAEAQGSPEEYFRYGEEDAALDFLSLTEHDIWMDDGEWRTLQELTAEASRRGRMLAFLGYEWTSPTERGGHHNVIYRRPDAERVAVQEALTPEALYRGLRAEAAPADVLVIPHAHAAADWNVSDPGLERLVEIQSMHGTFEWFGNLYLRRGWEVGFIGASDDHRAKPGLARGNFIGTLGQRGGLAAVVARERTADAVFDALRGLRAYATSGERILLDATLDGQPMGTRLRAGAERRLRAEVSGTAPIERIDVVKNGEVVFSRGHAGGELAERCWVQVGFASSSEVFPPPVDNPRLYRIWDGTFSVVGARLVTIDDAGLDNRYHERAAREGRSDDRVRFHVETRGRRDSFLVELAGARPATSLVLDLEPGREEGIGGPIHRETVGDLRAERIEVTLREIAAGGHERVLEVGPHRDRVTLRLVDAAAALDGTLEWSDTGDTAPGDYYYVRVLQLDGAQAWSSPFWVGESKRAARGEESR